MTPAPLRVGFAGAPGFDPTAAHLSVDGMTPEGPNLSHWPGNRTPRRYKADLSTGICLNFARAPAGEQAAFLAGTETVVNDHYDTDGFLAMLAVTRPDLAFEFEDTCLAAAATGDFEAYHGRRGFAIDRIVLNLAAPGSPVAPEFEGLAGATKSLARYEWLLANAETVLGDPDRLAACWLDDWRSATDELARCRAGALDREVLPRLGLSIVTTREPVGRTTLNSLAGAFRVLHVERGADGPRYRYHDRTESWFEVVTVTPLPRVDLRQLAERLQALEGPAAAHRWCADPPSEPVPELWFGVDTPQAYGRVSRELGASGLSPATVRDATATFFVEATS